MQLQPEQLLVSFFTKCDDHITPLLLHVAHLALDASIDRIQCKVIGDAAGPLEDHTGEESAQAAQLAGFLDEAAKRYNGLLRVQRIQTDHELLDALD